MRIHYQPWGFGLDDEGFAAALAALGCCRDQDRFGDADELAVLLQNRASRGAPWPQLEWRYVTPGRTSYLATRDPETLTEAWHLLCARLHPRLPRLRLATQVPVPLQARLATTLNLARPSSVWFAGQSENELLLSWPLNIGLFDDPAAKQVANSLRGDRWHGTLFELIRAGRGAPHHLLLLLEPLDRAVARLFRLNRRIDAGVVVVLAGAGTAEPALGAARTLRDRCHASAVAVLDCPAGAHAHFASTVVELFSHGQPMDVVLTAAASRIGAGAPLLELDPGLAELTLPVLFWRHGIRLASLSTNTHLRDLPEMLPFELGEARSVRGLGRTIRAHGHRLSWDSEGGDATFMAHLVRDTETMIRDDERRQPRLLQARLEEGDSAHLVPVDPGSTLRADTPHRVAVRVGLPDECWMDPGAPLDLPACTDQRPHRLQVAFWEPRLSPQPQLEPLMVPHRGSSEPCHFFVHTSGVNAIEARITVLHRGRVLQTGLLTAAVGTSSESGDGLRFTIDAAPLPTVADLDHGHSYDEALVLNRASDGQARAFRFRSDEAVAVDLREDVLEDYKKFFGDRISRISDEPDAFATLDSEASQTLLRELAQKGATLHWEVFEGHTPGPVRPGARVQIVSARKSFFPAEFLYAGPAPEEDAVLCPAWRQALARPEGCTRCERDLDSTVCPQAFWSLSRIIERHAHVNDDDLTHRSTFTLLVRGCHDRRELDPLRGALLAASPLASSVNHEAVSQVEEALEEELGKGKVALVADTDAWVEAVKSAPSLIVLLPHHFRRDGFEYLEIGDEEVAGRKALLKSDLVKTRHVKPEGEALPPIVLLMGCDTASARIVYDDFVSAFRRAGAAVTVATVASVLGRQAGPATEALIRQLAELSRKGTTMGEALLATRRSLFGQGLLLVLAFTAWGDADWRLLRS